MSEQSDGDLRAAHFALKVALGISSGLNVLGIGLFAWLVTVTMEIRDSVQRIDTVTPYVTSELQNDIDEAGAAINRLECFHDIGRNCE
ncbi:MAG TPA: hypothetical protein VF389_11660 [Woeseiaceae bacterium]